MLCAVAGCASTPNFVNRTLPPVDDVIPAEEPEPAEPTLGGNVKPYSIEAIQALRRANTKLRQGRENYNKLVESNNLTGI